MMSEGFLSGGDVIKAYVKPYNTPWREVDAVDVGGLAVFEGCIILGTTDEVRDNHALLSDKVQTAPQLLTDARVETRGAGIVGAQYRWRNRTVPFVIAPDVPHRERIDQAIAHWHEKTSLRFVPRTSETDFLFFKRDQRGCASMVGRRGGMQAIILGDQCSRGNITHELGHAIGLWHEQSRVDRDAHVEIVHDNIRPDAAPNFEQRIVETKDLGEYDFGSIMHYPPDAFAVASGEITIRPKRPLRPGVIMGQRQALSEGDIAAVNALYADQPMPARNG